MRTLTGSTENQTGNHFFNSRIEVSPDVISQEISGETVILDLKSDSYFGLDPTGTRIWELLQEGKDPEGILKIMTSEFEVKPEILKHDLAEHLQTLEAAGLITIID